MRLLFCISCLLLLIGPAAAQPSAPLPVIIIDDQTLELQTSLYPTYYQSAAAVDDTKWLQANSGPLRSFWQQHGESALEMLSRLGGIAWEERQVTLRLVRYYPTLGAVDPLILPLGGVRVGALTEGVPDENTRNLMLLYQLAHRLIWQGIQGRSDVAFGLANHPLTQPGPYYRDLLVMHLALTVGQSLLGADTVAAVYRSGFWQRHVPGHALYEQYLRNRWQLSEEKPLVEWLAGEPYDSKLATAVAPLTSEDNTIDTPVASTIPGIPPHGRLGVSFGRNTDGQVMIDKIDESRRGHKAGLRAGDIVLRVAGKRAQSYRELMEELLAGLERGPVSLQVQRNGKNETIILRR